jgi:flagellin
MRNLAVHASNTGATDEASRAADQAQIESAMDTLNRISQSTQFGTRQLLDGTSGVNATISNSNIDSVAVGKDANLGFIDLAGVTAGTQAAVTGSHAYTATSDTIGADGILTINGKSFEVKTGQTLQSIMDQVNSANIGVTATFNGTNMVFTNDEYGTAYKVDYNESADILNGGAQSSSTGTDSVATATYEDGTTEDLQGSGLQLRSVNDMVITLKGGATAGAYANAVYVKDDSLKFQVGAFAGQNSTVNIQSTAANNLGTSAMGLTNKAWTVADIDVTTYEGAQDALKLLDSAISEVSKRRSDLGAFQKNVLESNISSLSIAKENIAASESSIRDTDMAAEMVTFTRNQILMQAGTAMLSQANQAPQNLLSLLR